MMNRLFFIFLLLAVAPSHAMADFVLHFWEVHHDDLKTLNIRPQYFYFYTTSNFDPSGGTLTGSLQSYNRMMVDVEISYGLSDDWTVYARPTWARAEVFHPTLAGVTYGLADQTLGTSYRVWKTTSGWALELQGQMDLPAYDNTNSLATKVPFLGDATIDLTGGAFLTVALQQNPKRLLRIVSGAGFTWRTKSFSAAIPYSAELQWRSIGEGLNLSLAALGQFSLANDIYLNYGSAERTGNGSGGSYAINAINSANFTGRGTVGYRLSAMTALKASFSMAVWGQDYPKNWTVSAGAEFRLGGKDDSAPKTPDRQVPEEYGKSNKGFVSYTMEATVSKVNDRLNLVKINKGSDAGIKVGDHFDFFSVKTDGSPTAAVARGEVTDVKDSESALKITEYFREIWIEEGFLAKKPLD